MDNYSLNDNNSIPSKSSSKPYEKKIGINQNSKRNCRTEEEDDKIKYQIENEYDFENQEEQIHNTQGEEIQENIPDDFKKEELFQNDEIKDIKKYQKNENTTNSNEKNKDDIFQNIEYPGNSENTKDNFFNTDLNNNIEYAPEIQNYIQKEEYEEGQQFNSGEERNEINFQNDFDINNNNNYKYNYKYKKYKKTENEYEENGGNEEGEENEDVNEEVEGKDDIDNIDLQEIKKKPGRLLHQSKQETFDEEGNRIITTKTIKEFKQMSKGYRIKNIQNEKERIEYERYTTNLDKNNKKNIKSRKTRSSYKSDNRGDRVYLLAQLAKLKNEQEKNKIKKNQIYNNSQSPIIIHESNGYETYEKQNSIFSNDLLEQNSFDGEIYGRNNINNNNYRNNYGTVENNFNINNQEYREKFFYPNNQMRFSEINGIQMQEEYFGENDSKNNRIDIPSPIGYIATYSSGSEDNEDIGRSYEQYTNTNFRKTNSKKKIDKNIYKKEGELIKKSEIIYQLEDPNEYIGYEKKSKKSHNLSTNLIKAQIDTSKSDKRDFQSPERDLGFGSEKFRKVTMAMISSLGPTCEDRKITRKMRNEVGGVVDLRQEIIPINTYKIKKFQRFGYNLNKEVNPKTKLEGARIIQYWWRRLKEKKIYIIKYLKIVKIQSVVRRFLVRKKIIITRIVYYIYDTLDNIMNNHYKTEIVKFFKYSNEDKAKRKLVYIIKNLNERNNKIKVLKYFYKLKFITDLNIENEKKTEKEHIKEKIIIKEKKETKITEEMYIKYMKEKFLNNNKFQRKIELSIGKKERKPYEIGNKMKYEILKLNKELIDEETQDDLNKKINKEIIENKINKLSEVSFLYQKPKTNDQGTGQFSLSEGIDKLNFKFIKQQKEYKDSETNPIIQNLEFTNNCLSIIKPIKNFSEADSQYYNPDLPSDKNKEISKLINKKTYKEQLYLGSYINRWRKIALGEKIKKDIDNQRLKKLKKNLEIRNNCLKKYLKKKFEDFILVCRVPAKKIKPIQNDNFKIIDIRPKNKKVQLDEFKFEPKERPSLQIDKKDEYSIIKAKKIYKNEETQKTIEIEEKGVNLEKNENQIIQNELINFIKTKKETKESGTDPNKLETKISNISQINYINTPKNLIDSETNVEITPSQICSNEPLNIIKQKKELIDISIQYIDPSKPTSYEEILKIIIKKKISKNNLYIEKYFNKWYKKTKEDTINYNANKIISNVKGYLYRKYLKNKKNKKNGFNKIINIYEQLLIKQLKKRWIQFVNGCSIEPKKLEPNKGENFSIANIHPENEEEKINEIYIKPKEKLPYKINNLEKINFLGKIKNLEDFGTQKIPEIKDEETQNEIPKNEINKMNQITIFQTKKEMKDEYSQNEAFKPEISNSTLNIINKIEKEDKDQQIGSWLNIIKKDNNSFNIISNQIKKEKKLLIPNDIKQTINLEIIKKKKDLQDEEIQYIPEDNKIYAQEIEIKGNKPETKENSSQYIAKNPIICKENQYNILMNKKKEFINKYLANRNTNNISILPIKKELIENGEQYDLPQNYKAKEIIIGSKIKRSYTQKIIEILEKIWIKKVKQKFINNCKYIAKENKIKKELLRMALLRWRFIKGYGGDRYGIIYDRNGKEIGKKEGLVNDVCIQNNLDEEIIKENLKNKELRNKISQQNPIYIKSNIARKPKIMLDVGTGDEPNHIIFQEIRKNENISFNGKQRPKNIISKNNYFKINMIEKKLKDQGTYMPSKINKIVSGSQFVYINSDNKLKYNINRRRELLIQIISKKIIREKYALYRYFSKWYKNSIRIIEYEKRKKIALPKITKIEKFEIIQKVPKRDRSAGPNKIVHNSKVEYINRRRKKDIGILIDLPNTFKRESLKTLKINNDMYASYKKPIIVRQMKGETNPITSQNIITREISSELGTPLGREIVDEINIRITEIFVKFLESRTSPQCILRKYLSIWHRNSQYIPLLDNAKIIGEFCKAKLNSILAVKKWKKLYKKYLLTIKQYNIIKIINRLKKRKYKLIRLIRLTRLLIIFNKRKFLHYIMMYWLIYTITTIKKRNQIKMIYENMLSTYVSMADDIFGKNQKNNPSIQDCMFEIIDTDKFQIKGLEDVPIAKIYYSKKNGEKKIVTNIKYIEKELLEEKEYGLYKEYTKTYFPSNKSDINNTRKTERENKSEKRGNSYKGIYNRNKNSIDNKYTKSENNFINKRDGTGTYTFKGFNKTMNKNNIIDDIINNNAEARYIKRNYTYTSNNKTEDKNDNNISNNRYSSLKIEENNIENQPKEYIYKRRYMNNSYSNNSNKNNLDERRQKEKKESFNNYYSSNFNKYNNNIGKDNERENYRDLKRFNDNINKYSYRTNTETNSFNARYSRRNNK